MNPCTEFESAIERLLAEDIPHAERQRLLVHAAACPGCGSFVDMHRRLEALDFAADLPTDAAFEQARRAVLARLRAGGATRSPSLGASVLEFFRAACSRPAWAGALAAVVVGAAAVGLAVGHGLPRRIELAGLEDVREPLLVDLAREARGGGGLQRLEDSRYLLSNVTFDALDDERLSLGFDVTRRIEVARRRNDPLVRELLARSLVQPAPMATRLDALSYASEAIDPRVEEALIVALLNDPSVAVRLRALKVLAALPPNPRIRDAFVLLLGSEQAVQLRLEALDYLARAGGGRAEFDEILGRLEHDDDPALLARAARYREVAVPGRP